MALRSVAPHGPSRGQALTAGTPPWPSTDRRRGGIHPTVYLQSPRAQDPACADASQSTSEVMDLIRDQMEAAQAHIYAHVRTPA